MSLFCRLESINTTHNIASISRKNNTLYIDLSILGDHVNRLVTARLFLFIGKIEREIQVNNFVPSSFKVVSNYISRYVQSGKWIVRATVARDVNTLDMPSHEKALLMKKEFLALS